VKSVRTFVVGVLLCGATITWSQPVEWKDGSPHAATLIPVDDDAQLEVLDWGGAGPAIVLLAGLGDTAHVFDDFAPMLIARYRVLGVTRRAHGRSSAPSTGYGFGRLAEDVVRVIDAIGVKRPVIAGHSIAGEELHVLGARYSAKVAGLVSREDPGPCRTRGTPPSPVCRQRRRERGSLVGAGAADPSSDFK
jgi:pimeloyl-ACP methyl ester carboxylesterase